MAEDLRAHVEGSTYNWLENCAVSVVEVSGKAEVADFELAIIDQDIGWFEIPMNNIKFIEVLEAFHDVFEEVESFTLW